jgi:glycerol uptake facilitator-like aquaporin
MPRSRCSATRRTGAILIVLIGAMGPVSGAHFNPLVTLAFLLRREIERHTALAYIVVQIAGAVLGTWAVHLMFGVAPFEVCHQGKIGVCTLVRRGSSHLLSFSRCSGRYAGAPK